MAAELAPADGADLLALARASISDRLHGTERVDALLSSLAAADRFAEPRATFVTLRTLTADGGPGDLRGCIGTLEATAPLYRSIVDNACKAAFQDPRFPPLETPDLDSTGIAISVLTPLTPVDGPDAIVPGRDGVELRKSGLRAVFLPEVAEDYGWDTPELLRQLAIKARLPRADWRGGTLAVFRSEKFQEWDRPQSGG